MGSQIRLEVWGDYALFSRPELKVERVSYDVMTPSAAQGILKSIFWHPGVEYRIDRIHVLNPIRRLSVKRNEVKSKMPSRSVLAMMDGGPTIHLDPGKDRAQRNSLILKDVRYVIDAFLFVEPGKLNPGDSKAKFDAEFERRAHRGDCYRQPVMGCREFPAYFRPWDRDKGEPEGFEKGERDLGVMLLGMDWRNIDDPQPLFFHAALKDGVMDVRGKAVLR